MTGRKSSDENRFKSLLIGAGKERCNWDPTNQYCALSPYHVPGTVLSLFASFPLIFT